MKNSFFAGLILLTSFISLQAQAGLQIYSGLTMAKSKSQIITPSGLAHKGYHLGADARIIDDNMYFVLGGQYHVVNYLAQNDGGYFSIDNKMVWTKLRIGLGFQLYSITEDIILRTKTLGCLDFITKFPDLPNAPYQNYNSGTAGAVVGIGFDVFAFTLDIEYEKGFFNAVNMVEGTEFDFFTVNVGVIF